ncbi:MAG: hypothetical protein RR738_01690 [Anaerorhabdus sp.]|uniref:hypothetical protein n=1 Tax=Anaerorhabdus sp. TaxID=1872524 RepID=UPI002FC76EA1
MIEIKNKSIQWELLILFFLVSLTILSTVIKIKHGFDIDEGYAISMGMRLHAGDKLITDIWDPYQFSALFIKPFIDMVYSLEGNSQQIVLITRIFSVIIQAVVSIIVYRFLASETKNKFISLILSLCYFNFLPKQIQNIDHATTLVWFSTLFFISYLRYYKENKIDKLILMGIFYCCMVLAYPTQIILFPFILLIIFYVSITIKKINAICIFSIVCVVIGFITILCVNPLELIRNVKFIIMDGSHNFTFSYHFLRLIREIIRIVIYVIPLIVAACIINKLFRIKQNFVNISSILLVLWFGGIFILNFLGFPWPPISMYVRYFILCVIGFFLIEKNKNELKYLYILSFIMMSITFLSSNTGIDHASGFLIFISIISILIIFKQLNMQKLKKTIIISFLLFGTILLSEMMIKMNSVRITGTGFANRDSVHIMGINKLNNIYIQENQYKYYLEVDELLSQKDGKLIYCGIESLSLFDNNLHIVTPTTTGTPDFNSQWVEYYRIHPFDTAYLLIEQGSFNRVMDSILWSYFKENYQINEIYSSNLNILYVLEK